MLHPSGATRANLLQANFTGMLLPPVKLAEACPEPAEADSFTDRVDWPGKVNRVLSSRDASQDDPLDCSPDVTK